MMKILRPSVLLLVLVLVGGATSDQNQTHNQNQRLQVVPLDAQSSDVCVLPVVVGPCRASLPRFFYNATIQNCSIFFYGGCSANGNNFLTLEECQDRCRGVPESTTAPPSVKEASVASTESSDSVDSAPLQRFEKSANPDNERCGAEPVVGPCKAAFQRWFFNRSTGRCHTFVYGGCQGNQNNYQSEQSCSASCSGKSLPSAKMTGNDQQEENDVCLLTSDPGPCRAAFPMFYYNVQTQSCVAFIYGGCRGNKNRFDTEEECLTRCHGNGQSEEQDQNSSHWTTAVFLFVSLAVISVLILFIIIIVRMRRHNITRRSSAVSDKEELLPDDQTSVESLSLPDTSSPPPPKA